MARHPTTTPRRWSREVGTDSTFPPAGLFKRDARTIAETMARPEISPGGLGAAIRMVTFFINRAGRSLPERRAPGRYRHPALGPVIVEKCGRTWWMFHRPGRPPIALGPDGWCHLEPDRDAR